MSDKPRLCRWPLSGQVLVVDDDDPYRRIVSLRLQHLGCTCHTAATHEAALQLLHQNPTIAVAVLDYHMSQSEVSVLVNEIRRMRPDVVIVGHSSMRRSSSFAALGVEHFLLKPWSPEDLIDLLSSHIGHVGDR